MPKTSSSGTVLVRSLNRTGGSVTGAGNVGGNGSIDHSLLDDTGGGGGRGPGSGSGLSLSASFSSSSLPYYPHAHAHALPDVAHMREALAASRLQAALEQQQQDQSSEGSKQGGGAGDKRTIYGKTIPLANTRKPDTRTHKTQMDRHTHKKDTSLTSFLSHPRQPLPGVVCLMC